MAYEAYQHVAEELLRSRQAGSPYPVWVGDGSHKGADIYYSERIRKWVVIALDVPGATFHDSLAVVTLADGADAGEQLDQACLARDRDDTRGVWVVDADELDGLRGAFGEVLQVAWQSDAGERGASAP
jgi:hypothetical protein